MQYDEHQGMRLWVEPNDHLASGVVKPGLDVNLKIGVEPADASNKVLVKYRVNGGPAAAIAAEPVRHVGNTQYYNAQLPCATLCEGDTVEYSAACQCAGRQVPSAGKAEEFAFSFRVLSANTPDGNPSNSTYTRLVNPTATTSSTTNAHYQTTVSGMNRLKPTHLSLFALTRNSGHPIARMPFYAEVGVSSFVPIPKSECKLKELITYVVTKPFLNDRGYRDSRFSITDVINYDPRIGDWIEMLCDALTRLLSQDTIDQMARDNDFGESIIKAINDKGVELEAPAGKEFDWNDKEALSKILEEIIKLSAKELGVSLADENVQQQKIVWAHPLGVLATDHVGYLSFDLTRLPPDVAEAVAFALDARRRNPNTPTETSIWLYPMAKENARIDALAQMRFAHDAIVVKLELDLEDNDQELCQPKLCDSIRNLGIAAMQNPSLTDWRLSPGSFATSPGGLVGADDCETILPSNVALHEFNFHQVVGIPLAEVGLPIDAAAAGKIRPGFVNEYRLSFIPIGHSLGQILYTFPLAPGESVNFAVIDWTRRDSALRNESTKLDESLVHELRRDRIITETVQASIDEWQRGGSLMGGIGGSIGGIGMGGSAALGGAYSTTSGSRDIGAETVQKLSDNVKQAATASRELHSTVVVQSSQSEHEAIETRTVVNYNHSHALTILYYEVLRHFRVVTEFVRRRPALLTNIHGGIVYKVTPPRPNDPYEIYWPAIYENRKVLETALIDSRFKDGFDIAERRRYKELFHTVFDNEVRAEKDHKHLPEKSIPLEMQGPLFRYFVFEMKTGGEAAKGKQDVKIRANIDLIAEPWFVPIYKGRHFNPPGSFYQENYKYSFVGHTEQEPFLIHWGNIHAITIFIDLFKWPDDANFSLSFIKITGIDVNGLDTTLYEKAYDDQSHIIIDNTYILKLPTHRPQPLPPPPGPSTAEIEEEVKFREFRLHLLNNRAHYERALRLASNPVQRAFELSALNVGGGTSLLEKVDNRPLEVLGDFVAYPCTDSQWSKKIMDTYQFQAMTHALPDIEKSEQLITLPTRGVFAEAKLGHCNASEEIDNTRFWDWQKSPIPHSAPEIAAIEAGKHVVKDPNLQSTPFPQPIVNIVNPPSAPDPTGLASAMNVLATSNIFRDMSGRAEVADLLKKLSDNSVSIAEAANRAKEIQNKYGENLDKQKKDYDLGRYQATDLIRKAIEADSKSNSPTDARVNEANATKAEVEAGKAQAEAAKEVPKSMRPQVQQAAANTLAGNPKKTKVIIFKAIGFDKQKLAGVFQLSVRDVSQSKDVMKGTQVFSYYDESVTFTTPEPILEAQVLRKAGYPLKLFDQDISLPAIDIVPERNSYAVGKNHSVINITLQQASSVVSFKAKSTDAATNELMNKWGGELGIDKTVAAKIIVAYENKKNITHSTEEEKSYSINVPTQNYDLIINSG
jgi:hypothetical protein